MMAEPVPSPRGVVAHRLSIAWHRHGTAIMAAAVVAMVIAAAWRIGNELPRLLFDPDGAFDLRLRHHEVNRWFAGHEVYGDVERGDYPPASYAILWPLVGWLSLGAARMLWGVTALAALAGLALAAIRGSGARTRLQVLLAGLLPFSTYASAATLGMGQAAAHVLVLLVAGVLVLDRAGGRLPGDVAASALLLPALVKPTLSVPFFWIVAFRPGRLRPIVLVCLGYAGLTLLAIAFQDGPLAFRLGGWLSEGPQPLHGHTNIHKAMAVLGMERAMLPVTAAILLATGWWIFRRRDADVWILLGVAALVAQLSVHHRLYDHLLILVPTITLLRLAWGGARPPALSDPAAGVLFAIVWFTLHLPPSMIAGPSALSALVESGQAVAWVACLAFLVRRASRGAPSEVGR
ncbi:MAG TPA: hypothetical protein VK936_14000 [Longimicrobiales bacterium]|nr:hypothetical protein [Longimicrobiales bacterium]